MSGTIEIFYKCKCMAAEVALQVPARRRAHNVVAWVEDVVAHRIARDHARRNPACRERVMEHLKIPAPPGTENIGEPPA